MTTLTGQFIFLCWAVFIIYWIVASIGVKRTVEKQAGWWRILILLIAAAIAFFMINHDASLWSYTLTIGIIADIVTLIGLIIILWARTVLGGAPALSWRRTTSLFKAAPTAMCAIRFIAVFCLWFLAWQSSTAVLFSSPHLPSPLSPPCSGHMRKRSFSPGISLMSTPITKHGSKRSFRMCFRGTGTTRKFRKLFIALHLMIYWV